MIEYILQCNIEGLQQIDNYKWRGRCPICGDSQKSIVKKRFYILLAQNRIYCHNCHISYFISEFLKIYYPEVFKQYINDTYFHKKEKTVIDFNESARINKIELTKFIDSCKLFGFKKDLSKINFVNDYLKSRNLLQFKNKFWYIENFYGLTEFLKTGEIKPTFDPRLIIPFTKNDTKEIYAIQGRTLINKIPKYITFMLNTEYHKLYNYHNIDKSKLVYITEGPIDSMFLPNSIALTGSKINQDIINFLKSINCIMILDTDFIYNNDIRKIMKQFISEGLKVYIPSKEHSKFKDINDLAMVYTKNEILDIINNNNYSGITANVKMSEYRKRIK
jgi:hypothetical protein